MSHQYEWRVVVEGVIEDSSDDEDEIYRMYNEYKEACGDERIYVYHNNLIVRESIPGIKS